MGVGKVRDVFDDRIAAHRRSIANCEKNIGLYKTDLSDGRDLLRRRRDDCVKLKAEIGDLNAKIKAASQIVYVLNGRGLGEAAAEVRKISDSYQAESSVLTGNLESRQSEVSRIQSDIVRMQEKIAEAQSEIAHYSALVCELTNMKHWVDDALAADDYEGDDSAGGED